MTLSATVDFAPYDTNFSVQAHGPGMRMVPTMTKAGKPPVSSHNLQHFLQGAPALLPVPTSGGYKPEALPSDLPCLAGLDLEPAGATADPFWTWLNGCDDPAVCAPAPSACSQMIDVVPVDAQPVQMRNPQGDMQAVPVRAPLPVAPSAGTAARPADVSHVPMHPDSASDSNAPPAMAVMPGLVMAAPNPWMGAPMDGRFVPWGQQYLAAPTAALGQYSASAAAAVAAAAYVPRTLLPHGACASSAAVSLRREKWSRLKAKRAAWEGRVQAVRYEKRKRSAEMRPRVQGRFVRRDVGTADVGSHC